MVFDKKGIDLSQLFYNSVSHIPLFHKNKVLEVEDGTIFVSSL
jgi:hypothetical protein